MVGGGGCWGKKNVQSTLDLALFLRRHVDGLDARDRREGDQTHRQHDGNVEVHHPLHVHDHKDEVEQEGTCESKQEQTLVAQEHRQRLDQHALHQHATDADQHEGKRDVVFGEVVLLCS